MVDYINIALTLALSSCEYFWATFAMNLSLPHFDQTNETKLALPSSGCIIDNVHS